MRQTTLPSIEADADSYSGRTATHLGPSDSSDSASDLAGLDDADDGDPNAPVDVALRGDGGRSLTTADALGDAASDAAGTGESRSAGADAGREAADVGVDRVFKPGARADGAMNEDEDPDLAFVDPVDGPEAAQAGGLQNEGDNIPGAEPQPDESIPPDGPIGPDEPEEIDEIGDPDEHDAPGEPGEPREPDEPDHPDERRPGRDVRDPPPAKD